MLSCFSHIQLCLTLKTIASQTPLSMGFSRQESWSGLPCPPPGNLADAGIEPESLTTAASACEPFTLMPPGKSHWGPSVQFSSIAQSCPTLCDPMDCSTSGFPVRHQLLEPAQTHVHRVDETLQPSHFPSSPLPPSFNLSQHQGFFPVSQLFTSGGQRVSFSFSISPSNEHSGLTSFRMDWFDFLAVQGTLKSSPTPQFKSISSSALSFLYSPTLTSIHDLRKNHSLD